jgi:sarcosine/dimethylglycine N-methyltransferase
MATLADVPGPGGRVLDMGSGYGGAARHLARSFGCSITALNLSEIENTRAREMNKEQGLDDRIDVLDGTFEDVPLPDASCDLVWSQDAILHSGRRGRVIAEAARVLRPGGALIMTDPMQADDCPGGVLQPVLDRIHLSSLGSVAFYRAEAARNGLREAAVIAMPEQLTRHYSRVREELEHQRERLGGRISEDYIARMSAGLGHWIDAGRAGHLNWGILHFRKAAG